MTTPTQPRPSPEPAPRPPPPQVWSHCWDALDAALALVLAVTRPRLVGRTVRERYHRVRQRQRFWRQAQWVRRMALRNRRA